MMPIYEYTCRACGELFESWLASMKDVPTAACPQCGSQEVQRRISAPAIRTGGASGGSPIESTPAKPEVFGRKELNSTLRARGEKPAKE
jgi:putative FmdB family regulatory protein